MQQKYPFMEIFTRLSSIFLMTLLLSLGLLRTIVVAQTPSPPRQAQAIFSPTPLKIDGYLEEEIWKQAPVMTDFVELSPVPFRASAQRTEVRVVYTMESIYIGAKLFDSAPDSILRQLCVRDDIFNANTDNFGVHIDAMHTRQNAFAFMVSAAGVQYDDDNGDEVWDGVWRSRVRITDEGWQVEMEIPYSQLRFPPMQAGEQVWGINFSRTIRRTRENSYWAKLDPTIDNRVLQYGTLAGLSNIRPPLRLSLTPYVAGYLRHFDDGDASTPNWRPTASAGADLKYGINESFTLDVALIPDFGDIQSDNLELNLSPFEIYYDERRPFFTEGIELFNRGTDGVDLSLWRFSEGINFQFHKGTMLAAGHYLVVAANTNWMRQVYGDLPLAGNFKGRLSHKSELLRLIDRFGNLVCEVDYHAGGDWPDDRAEGKLSGAR